VRTREAVIAIRELLAGRSPAGVPGAAPGWTAQAVPRVARTTQVYIGALGPRMLELAGRLADGALALCLPPRHVHRVVEHIGIGATKAGRRIEELDVAACVWVSIADDRAEARRLLAEHVARYSGSLSPDALAANGFDPTDFARTQQLMDQRQPAAAVASVTESMLELGIVGAVDDVIDRCAGLIESGVRHISFGPPLGPDRLASIRLLGRRVLPVLRAQLGR
jgi:5,10-methylenetetrahydromethanopterin reductase